MALNKDKKVYIESLAIILTYSILGFLITKEDPLFIKGRFDYPIILLALLTLYYGIIPGLISMFFLGAIMYLAYTPMPINSFFWLLLLTFIFGEFHILWERRINRLKEENRYFSEKLDDLGKEMFVLRASYEQLERSYILKPFSIRNSLKELRQKLLDKGEIALADFMSFLEKITGIENASLYLKRERSPVEISRIGSGAPWDENDPLIKLMQEKESTVFVSVSEVKDGSNYQAAIPIFGEREENIRGYLLIKSMSFLQLNRDNLLTMSILTAYFFSEFEVADKIKEISDKLPHLDSAFLKELLRIMGLKKRLGVESSIVKFSVQDKYLYDVVTTFIESKLRGLDLATKYQEKDEYWFFVLLPLTSYANAHEFLTRTIGDVEKNLGKDYLQKIRYNVLPVTAKDEIDMLNRVIES